MRATGRHGMHWWRKTCRWYTMCFGAFGIGVLNTKIWFNMAALG